MTQRAGLSRERSVGHVELPPLTDEVLPGIAWGALDAFPTPAYWAYQVMARRVGGTTVCPCPWNPYPIAESRIGLLGLSRMPVLLEPHRAGVRQRGVQPGAVVPEYPGDDLVLGLASRHEALPMQSLHLQRTEQGLAAGVVPAVALAAHRGRDAALGEHVPEVLAGVLAAPVAVEDQPGMLARMALEPGHAHSIDDDVARHVLAQ